MHVLILLCHYLFFNGPQADAQPNPSAADGVEPMPVGESEYARAERMGRVLAQRAATMFNANKKTFDMRQMRLQNVTARLPITNHLFIAIAGKGFFNGYYDFVSPSPDPDARATAAPQAVTLATTLVTRLTFGQVGCTCLEMVTIPGEASNKVGAYIRGLSPHDMALLGLTQNSFGYILDEDQYGSENGETLITEGDPVYPLGYEESVSMGPASAIALREQGWNVLFGATPGTGAGQ